MTSKFTPDLSRFSHSVDRPAKAEEYKYFPAFDQGYISTGIRLKSGKITFKNCKVIKS